MLKPLFCYIGLSIFIFSCTQKQDEKKILSEIKTLHKKAFKNIDSTSFKLNRVRTLVKKHNILSDSIKAKNDYMFANYFKRKSINDSASIYFHKAKDYVKDHLKNRNDFRYYDKAWNFHLEQGKYGDCFAIAEKYKALTSENDHYYQYMIENTYKAIKEYGKALRHNKLQVKALSKIRNSNHNINEALIIRAQYLFELSNKERGFYLLDSLRQIEKQLNNHTKHNLYRDYAVRKYQDNNFKEALIFFKKGIYYLKKIKKNATKKNEIAGLYNNISNAYIKLKEFNSARIYIDSAIVLTNHGVKTNTIRSILKTKLKLDFLSNKEIDNINNSLDSLYSFQENRYNQKIKTELLDLKTATENERKILAEKNELEIKSIKRFFTLLGVSLLIISIGFLFYKQRKHNFEKQNLLMQQRLLRLQMNPHFTFNTLYAIQNTIEETPKLATKYLLKFSRLLRLILENSTQNYVQLSEEIEALHKYIDLQELRFLNRFDFEIQLNDIDEDDLIFIPPMLIQPIIENSIEHGLTDINYKGKIQLKLSLLKNTLACTIEDNGKGLQNAKDNSRISSTKLISNYLKKTTKKEITIKNKTNENGVIVSFEIPFKLTEK
ncbi:histidine kinase [uncultured Tenacibaculum sp.]|uniref:sensor histidine kinase n=1 Tax=uncultured Tenacibaculum sp. TaxID=174713 RepID=UPI00261CFE53|nr:histidine kinase [uncultured Tenacibaculum sp.]